MPLFLIPDQKVVSQEYFGELVLERLGSLLGLSFPANKGSRTYFRSLPILSVPFDPALRKICSDNGYVFEGLIRAIRMSKNRGHNHPTHWDFDSTKDTKFDFLVTVSIPDQTEKRMLGFFGKREIAPENGITLRIDTQPWISCGNDEDVAELLKLFHEHGTAIPSLCKRLLENSGSIEMSWRDLDLEDSVTIEKFFLDFLETLSEEARKFVRFLAVELSFSPLDPTPYYLSEGTRSMSSMIMPSPFRVPESQYETVRQQWFDQLYQFGETRLPQRVPADPPPLT